MKAQSTRTTLSIDNDVMLLLRERATASGESLGKTASRIIRQAVTATDGEPRYFNGIRLFPARPGAKAVTMELVNQLRDETY